MRRTQHLEMVKKALSGFSLNDAETSMYLSVLNGGAKPVSQVAKAAGLKRSYAYDVLESLVRKGLLLEVEYNGLRRFVTTELDEVLELMNQRELRLVSEKERLRSFIPNLESLRQSAKNQAELKEYRGASGVEAVYSLILNNSCELLRCFRSYSEKEQILREEFERQRIVSRIWLFSLLDIPAKQQLNSSLKSQFEKQRIIKGLALDADIYIYGDSVALISNEKLFAVTTSLAILSNSMRMLHEGYWQFFGSAEAREPQVIRK